MILVIHNWTSVWIILLVVATLYELCRTVLWSLLAVLQCSFRTCEEALKKLDFFTFKHKKFETKTILRRAERWKISMHRIIILIADVEVWFKNTQIHINSQYVNNNLVKLQLISHFNYHFFLAVSFILPNKVFYRSHIFNSIANSAYSLNWKSLSWPPS